jgi:hypothetical protein
LPIDLVGDDHDVQEQLLVIQFVPGKCKVWNVTTCNTLDSSTSIAGE